MQIQLKQVEIVEALKQYITNKGINLTGTSVKIEFTAGRKEAGLSVDLSIDDIPFPASDEAPVAEAAKPALSLVKTEAPAADAGTVVITDGGGVTAAPASSSLFN